MFGRERINIPQPFQDFLKESRILDNLPKDDSISEWIHNISARPSCWLMIAGATLGFSAVIKGLLSPNDMNTWWLLLGGVTTMAIGAIIYDQTPNL